MLQNEEFIQEFVEEARSHIDQVEADLLELAGNKEDPEPINRLFRSVHSIKGTAGFFGLDNIVKLSHTMENLFGALRNGRITLDDASIDALLEANDCLRSMVEDVVNSGEVDISSHIDRFNAILDGRNLVMEETQKEKVKEAIRFGHKLYRIRLKLYRDLDIKGITPIEFFNKVQSIGQVLDSYSDFSQIRNLDDVLDSDIEFVFLFTTVLEKNLVAIALDIPENSIDVLDVETHPGEYEKLLLEDIGEEKENKENQVKDQTVSSTKSGAETLVSSRNPSSIALEDSIRVPVSLLNDLMNLASELVLGRNQLMRGLETYRKNIEGMDPIIQNIDHITTQLQERIMQTRMQPLGNVFNKFPRIIRDLSKQLGKEIRLKIEGAQVELDKSIIESLADPLTHLIRNAADHGIEKPEIRERMGKDREGVISIGAFQEGGHVSILISDDGSGMDVEKIKEKVLEKELKTPRELAVMNDKEVLNLIFLPGFSTAGSVTDLSGRGVGMDVVRTNIERMGGSIDIDSQPGKGSSFKLNLPLTLAIISSLIVEGSGQKFALPQVNLQEVVRVKPGDKDRRIERINQSLVLRFRGEILPIVILSQVLGMSSIDEDQQDSQLSSRISRILVLKVGDKRFGLMVDAIHDDEEILVKPLPRHLKDCRCYSGVTILGDGDIAMILDAEGIAAKAELKFTDIIEDSNEQQDSIREANEQRTMLLFSCSGSETLALDLSLISRVEKISPDDIQLIGDKEYIEFRGHTLRLVRPEDYVPISKKEYTNPKLYVIVPKLGEHPMGILISRIQDTALLDIDHSRQDIKAKGIMGTSFRNKKIVLLLNLYELMEMAAPEYYGIGG